MTPMDDIEPEIPDSREEETVTSPALQLRLAAGIVGRLIERNGGSDAAERFLEDVLESLDDGKEYRDPELGESDEETLPEARDIEWNIFECD